MSDDMHRKGLFIIHDPNDEPILTTTATTGYASRAEFIQRHNQPWSKAQEAGYAIAEYAVVGKISDGRKA